MPVGKREAEATAGAATIAGGEGTKRRRTDAAAGMEVVEPPQVPLCFAWMTGRVTAQAQAAVEGQRLCSCLLLFVKSVPSLPWK